MVIEDRNTTGHIIPMKITTHNESKMRTKMGARSLEDDFFLAFRVRGALSVPLVSI